MSKFDVHLKLLANEGQRGDSFAYELHRELAGQPDADIPALAKVYTRRHQGQLSPSTSQIISSIAGMEVAPDIASAKANFLQGLGLAPGQKLKSPLGYK